MKIDELKRIIDLNESFGYIDCNRYDEEFEIITDALKELLWYREQDLASKQTTKDHLFYEWTNGTMQTIEDILDVVEQIPKAEPPIDECTPNCEKRFTCKHCIQGMYCNSRTGNEDGTPCCCEPKEECRGEDDAD